MTTARSTTLFVCMTAIWGASYMFTSIALTSWSPIALVAFRLALGAVMVGGGVLLTHRRMPRGLRPYLGLAALAVINISLPYFLLTWAQTDVPAGLTSVLSSTTPIFVFIFALAIHTDEHFSALRLVGVIVAFGGVALLCGLGGGTTARSWWAPLVIILSSAIFGLGNVLTRLLLVNVDAVVAAFLQLGMGAVIMIPIAIGTSQLPTSMTPAALLSAIELGVLGSGLCYALFFTLIRHWGSTRTSLNTYLQPVVGVVLGIAVLGERLTPQEALGMGVIFAGVAVFGAAGLVSRRRGRRLEDPVSTGARARSR